MVVVVVAAEKVLKLLSLVFFSPSVRKKLNSP